jgi:L,D-transpeptidase ErfK/SrfK
LRVTSWPALGRGLLLAVLSGTVAAGHPSPSSSVVAGGPAIYTARLGDSLTSVAARFGMDVPALAELNSLKPTVRLKLGQELRIHNPHIVPNSLNDGLLINIPQRMLFYFKSGKLQATYPVAVGRRTWPTPRGDFEVLEKEEDKTWIVPISIQEEMLTTGKPVRETVPPGPDNPLGRYWIRISPSVGIHGTNAPASIYKFQTHGCIRLIPEDIERLFKEVPIGTPVKVVYQPVLLARLPDGHYYLKVHPDIYRKGGNPFETVKEMAEAVGADSMIDWQEVRKAIREKRGLAETVILPPADTP